MTKERWEKLSSYQQLRNIATELMRARALKERGEIDFLRGSLLRALELVDLSLADPKWKNDQLKLEILRKEIEKAIHDKKGDGVHLLSRVL